MRAILFSDIDGTLFRNKAVSKEDIEAVRRFREVGNTFMLCTGRTPPSVQHFLDAHPQLECDGAVLGGGAGICGTTSKSPAKIKMLEKKMIDRQASLEIITYIYENEPAITVHWSDGERRISLPDRCAKAKLGMPEPEFMSIDEWKKENASMLVLVLTNDNEDAKDVQRVQKYVLERWGQYVEGFTNNHYLDISPKGVDKGSGIRRAIQLCDSKATCFGVGDGFNDVPMFEALGKEHSFLIASGESSLEIYTKAPVSSVAECIYRIMENS